ncbi:MAG: hypothetical protein ABI760_08720 [Ferruginibacter sp.]
MLAPIVLFVYNRPQHTLKTLEALARNSLASSSELIIYSDGPKENNSKLDNQKIKVVRAIIRTKKWCRTVDIIERDLNIGLANSVIQGVTDILNKYGKIIVLEDDIVTGNYFLTYMNHYLDECVNAEKIFGITGFSFSDDQRLVQPYLLPILSSWGWGTWSNSWKYFISDPTKFTNSIDREKFNFGSYPYFEMLTDQLEGKVDSWAIRFYTSMFLQNGFFVYPPTPLVRNIGFDNTGEHCNDKNPFEVPDSIDHKSFNLNKVSIDKKIISIVKDDFYKKLRNPVPETMIKRLLNVFKI